MACHTVRVDSGKYTFIVGDGKIKILRHGEEWHEQSEAFNALHSIVCELDAARTVLQAARSLVAISGEPTGPVARALTLHDALVSDRELPSDWCVQ